MNAGISSWLLSVRDRLTESRPHRLGEAGERAVGCICLFVQEGELRTLLVVDPDAGDSLAAVRFPARVTSSAEDPWSIVGQLLAEEAGIAKDRILRLGELDEERFPGGRLLACVAAVPPVVTVSPAIRQAIDPVERGGSPEELIVVGLVRLLDAVLNEAGAEQGALRLDLGETGRFAVQDTTAELVLRLAEVLGLADA